jgi:hypothetical protein
LGYRAFVGFEGIVNLVKPVRPALVYPDARLTKLPQRALAMRDHDQAGVVSQFFES